MISTVTNLTILTRQTCLQDYLLVDLSPLSWSWGVVLSVDVTWPEHSANTEISSNSHFYSFIAAALPLRSEGETDKFLYKIYIRLGCWSFNIIFDFCNV